ncbi:hypothetical protein AVEN_211047-1 [Araneus ventricosus]|uniref:Uncharacterized protein n=1 Tax=Araneus ventricosus TaxID=182803 RepID=A0A4Y2J4Z8_ARAVE|nr:hypothetical protein AVEN_211047-1 [Araneus ventricosus]
MFNTEQRKNSKSAFENDFFKLMNNSVYWKTMENSVYRVDVQLENDGLDWIGCWGLMAQEPDLAKLRQTNGKIETRLKYEGQRLIRQL